MRRHSPCDHGLIDVPAEFIELLFHDLFSRFPLYDTAYPEIRAEYIAEIPQRYAFHPEGFILVHKLVNVIRQLGGDNK